MSDTRTACRRYSRRGAVPRSHRRVMLVLLSGAARLSGYPISRAAMTGAGHVYIALGKMERLGWVTGEWETPDPLPEGAGRRRFYQLTLVGRVNVLAILGLQDGE
jgi:DNA-binding PadR family transcriptional regulator